MPSELNKKKRKRRRYPKRANSAQHFRDWATKGRDITVNGKDLRVYTKGKLLEAFSNAGIPRTRECLKIWEHDGVLPRSPIVIGRKQYYTQGMIEAVVLTCIECGVGKKMSVSKKFLSERIFYEFNKRVEKELF